MVTMKGKTTWFEKAAIALITLAVFLAISGLVYGGQDIPSWYNPNGDNWTKTVKIVKVKDESMFVTISELVESEKSDKVEMVEIRLFIINEKFLKDNPAGVPLFAFIDTNNNGKADMVVSIPRLGTSPRREKLDIEIDMTADAAIKWMADGKIDSKI